MTDFFHRRSDGFSEISSESLVVLGLGLGEIGLVFFWKISSSVLGRLFVIWAIVWGGLNGWTKVCFRGLGEATGDEISWEVEESILRTRGCGLGERCAKSKLFVEASRLPIRELGVSPFAAASI